MADALAPKRREDQAGVRTRGGYASARAPPPALTRAAVRLAPQIGGTKRYPWQEKLWEKSFDAAMKSLPLAMGVPGDSSDSGGSDSSDSDDEPAGCNGDVAQARDLRGRARCAARARHAACGGCRLLTPPPRATQAAARRGRGAGASSSSGSEGEGAQVLRHGEAVGRDGIFVSGALRSRFPPCMQALRPAFPAAGTRAELALARELAKDPWGRFGGRQGKMARIAAAEAAAAVAAGRAPPPVAAPVASGPEADAAHAARRREERDKRKAEKAAAAQAAAAKAKAEAASRKRARAASPPPPPPRIASVADDDAPVAPAPQHWWSRLFHSAGAMLGAEHTARKERGFCEADQEALFMDAHGGKTEGRIGLGRRSDANPLKIGGARWAGSKVAFADADDADAGEKEEDVPAAAGDADDDAAAAAGGLKWRKLAQATLAAAPKGALKEKKLRKAVLAAAAAKLGWHQEGAPPDGSSAALKAAFEAADPLSSSRFARLPCGRVALAAAQAGDDEEAEAEAEEAPRKKKSKKRRE
jgi:hypothetical protein